MQGSPTSSSAKQKGQSTLEFALVLPVFLGAFFGLVFFSVLFYSYVTLQLAVREGASTLVHHPEQSIYSIRSEVCNSGFAFIRGQMSVKVEPPDTAGTAASSCASLNASEGPYTGWQTGIAVAVTGFYTVPLPNVSIPINGSSVVLFSPIQIQAMSVMTFD
jgi:Flp pilus assembly protein TadG